MHTPTNMSLVISLCLLGGLVAACDEAPAPAATVELELGVAGWPRVASLDQLAELPLAVAPRNTAFNPSPEGKLQTLAVAWMRWALELPEDEGPINDPTGERCAMGQDGPVWFLAGTFGGAVTRECTIPAGKQLFFPLLNLWFVVLPEWIPEGHSIEEIVPFLDDYYQQVAEGVCSLTLRIDGEEVLPDFDALNEELYVRIVEPFEVVMNEDNFIDGFPGGFAWASGHGHYAWVPPLPPGDHVIELGGSNCTPFVFETAATYHLHIKD